MGGQLGYCSAGMAELFSSADLHSMSLDQLNAYGEIELCGNTPAVSPGPFKDWLEWLHYELAFKQRYVVSEFRRVWASYERPGVFGGDEINPITGKAEDTWGGVAMTLLDSLDSLYLMGTPAQMQRALRWLSNPLYSTARPISVNLFETTIRRLGGLLSAYWLTNHPALLRHAAELGSRLLPAFGRPVGGGCPPSPACEHFTDLNATGACTCAGQALSPLRPWSVTELPSSDIHLTRGLRSNLNTFSSLAGKGQLRVCFLPLLPLLQRLVP